MKRYQFRLARVLRVRRLQEEILRAAMLEARAKADGARAAERAQAAERDEGMLELERLQAGAPLEIARVLGQHDLLERLAVQLRRLDREARRLEADAARRADAAREARAGVRGLERLDDRRRHAHVAEQAREEQAQADESAARRFQITPATQLGTAPAAGSRPERVTVDSPSWSPPGSPPTGQQVSA